MKTRLLLTGIVTLFCYSICNAQIIYSNAFNGGAVSVNVRVPTASTNYAGGTSSAWWTVLDSIANTSYLYENGTIGTNFNTSLLPFTPENGYVYTLTASVTVPTMTAGKWITMGFAATNPPLNTASDPRFGSTLVVGNPWTYLTEGSGGDFFYPLRATTTGSSNLMSSPGTYTVQLVLDTTGTQWKASEFVNGTQVGTTYTYSSNPTITAVGLGQTTLNSSTGIQWNYVTLGATGTRSTNTANATVSFSGTGSPLNPAFVGLSYDKAKMTTIGYFSPTNTALLNLYSTIVGPAILRIGGGTVDTTGWNGISNTIPITAAEVDDLAGFINALPGNWQVIYGINLLSNTADNCEAEAVYVANDLGSRLAGFEVGNEPEFGFSSYSSFLGRWRLISAAITNHVPDWAVTNGGDGWFLDGADAGQGQLSAYTDPFATNESGVASLLTQHYYETSGGQVTDTMQTMLTADPFLVTLTANIVAAAKGHCSLGARISECGSSSAGGTLEMSDVYGAALWSLDFMFTVAVNGGQGINFHGGGKSPYSPLNDNGTTVTFVGPEFYGMKMFSLLPQGNVVPATLSVPAGINFTAYGLNCTAGGKSALLINKEVNTTVSASVNLGSGVSSVALITMQGPNLYCTNDYTIGGSAIYSDGTWTGGVESVLSATNGLLTVKVPPISAYLLIPYTWHSWDNPGGGIPAPGTNFISAFATCSWTNNRVDIFGIGSDHQLYHNYWDHGSGWLSPWQNLALPTGVTPAGGPGASANLAQPYRLDDYIIGTDGNCYHQDWQGSWSAWQSLGHPSSTNLVGTPSATSWAPGRVDVYCKGADNAVYRDYWTASTGWSGWIVQGGNIIGDPASVAWAPNNLDAYVVGTDDQIWHQYWNGSSFIPSQTTWQQDLPEITTTNGVAVSSWGFGRQDIFVNTGSAIAHNWYNYDWNANGETLPTLPVTPVSAPSAVSWGLDRIDVVILGSDGKCYHTYYGE